MNITENEAILLYKRIKIITENITVPENSILLYHGSKKGITGNIAPISREHCDFGAGFYMGTHPEQVLTLICDFPKAKFYLLSVKTSNIKIKELPTNIEWAMLIAYHRGRMEKIKGTAYYEKYHTFFNQHDMVIGSIANDKMFQVLDDFFIGNITDTVLINCLAALNLGKQYVAITQKGCEAIQIEQEIHISSSERKSIQDISEKNRTKGILLANEIYKKYRRSGKYFDEILDEAGKE